MMWKLTIDIDLDVLEENRDQIPNKAYYNFIKDKPILIVEFDTQQEKDDYIKGENRYAEDALKAFAAAWTKKERNSARVALYLARRQYNNLVMQKVESDLKSA